MMDEDDENSPLSLLLSHLTTSHTTPLPKSLILALQSLLDSSTPIFDILSENNIPTSSLTHSLSLSIENSPEPNPYSRLPLLASQAYLSLLLSPNSPLYSLFAPLPFLSLLRPLRRSQKLPNPSSQSPSSPANRKKNPRKRRPRNDDTPQSTSSPASFDCTNLVSQVLQLVDKLLHKLHLDGFPDVIKPLAESISEIVNSTAGNSRTTETCFRILFSLVSMPEHGDQTKNSLEVFRSLSNVILNSGKSPARSLVLGFVTKRVIPFGRENESVRAAVVYFPRFLVGKAPEKSEGRACAVDSILEVVRVMEREDRAGFAEYVVKMTNGKPKLRLLGVDLILAMLSSLPDPLGLRELEQEDGGQWGKRCLKAIIERCSDSTAGIRARALTNLALVVSVLAEDLGNREMLCKVVGISEVGFNQLLRKRCQDEKAAVKKAALLLITKSTALMGASIDEILLKTLASACSDSLVSIRKSALAALSEVHRRNHDVRVINEWLHAVPRLIVDNESSIQEECESLFLELVLDKISRADNVSIRDENVDLESLFPDGILELLKGTSDGEVLPFIKKICTSLGKKRKLQAKVAKALQNIIKISESLWLRTSMPIERWTAPQGAWQLLAEVSLFTPKAVQWMFLQHHWQLLDKGGLEAQSEVTDEAGPCSTSWAGDRVSLLQTISNVSLELPPEPAAELACNLLERLKNFNMHLSEVDAHVKALKTLCKRKATQPGEGDTLVLKWVHQLLSKATEILESYISEVSELRKADSFLTPQTTKRSAKKATSSSSSSSKLSLQAVTAVFTIGSLVIACPTASLQGIIPLLHTIITSASNEPKPKKLAGLKVSFKEVALPMYIQSWMTLGKICLVDDKLAKNYIPLFVQELEKSDSAAALRNNIMVAMADFCVRYTALVDCYIPKITTSLRDPCEVVRRQTFILLSRLLQRDYVKWRGVLFLRFLLSLVDESEKIRDLADFLFGSILKIKAPLLAYNSFIEAIFVLNDYHVHTRHKEKQRDSSSVSSLFSVRGTDERSRTRRMHIYVSLLKQMAPEHLLATSAKLCAEILAAASDGVLSIDDVAGRSVLQDALEILACKEMRIHPSRASDSNEMEEEVVDGGNAAMAAAKGRAVTQAAKKNLIQIAIPIFIELKRLLESKNSPLTGCLMACLRALLKDYKNEIEEILVADKQLQKELLYDMQKHEAEVAKSAVKEAAANAQRSENYRSPNLKMHGTGGALASAAADAAAKATARSVLKEVNQNIPTPPLGSMSVPRLKSTRNTRFATSDRAAEVLESVRRRQNFESDEEN